MATFPADVTDVRSNPKDQIAHAAELLQRSKLRRRVFIAIYTGKQRIKRVSEVMRVTKLDRITVLHQGRALADNRIVKQIKLDGETAYEKDRFYGQRRQKILSLATNRRKLETFPTKTRPSVSVAKLKLKLIRLPSSTVQISRITIDDIDSFSRVRHKRPRLTQLFMPLPEKTFKEGFQRIVGEPGSFTDWGGERHDLFTTRLRIKGRRTHAAIAFKGKGLRVARLTTKYMGKNGDQVQSLFSSPAQAFLVQYWREIDASLVEQMQEFAKAKSATSGEKIYFGIIDGKDSSRLIAAYPSHFARR